MLCIDFIPCYIIYGKYVVFTCLYIPLADALWLHKYSYVEVKPLPVLLFPPATKTTRTTSYYHTTPSSESNMVRTKWAAIVIALAMPREITKGAA